MNTAAEPCFHCQQPTTVRHKNYLSVPVCPDCQPSPATADELATAMKAMIDRYFWVVWYTRGEPQGAPGLSDACRASVLLSRASIEVAYADSIPTDEEQHGFNLGMLAALRYVTTAQQLGIKAAEREFPNLDS